MPADNTILMGAGVALLGLVGLWAVRTLMSLRDEVRELRLAVSDPRTGILAMFDKLMVRFERLEDRYNSRFGADG